MVIPLIIVVIPTLFGSYKDIYNYLFTNNYEKHYQKGLNYYGTGQIDKAIFHFEKAFNTNPNYSDLAFHYGKSLYDKKDFNQALFVWKYAKNEVQKNKELDFYRAESYIALKDSANAIIHYKKAINLIDTDNVLYWVSKAKVITIEWDRDTDFLLKEISRFKKESEFFCVNFSNPIVIIPENNGRIDLKDKEVNKHHKNKNACVYSKLYLSMLYQNLIAEYIKKQDINNMSYLIHLVLDIYIDILDNQNFSYYTDRKGEKYYNSNKNERGDSFTISSVININNINNKIKIKKNLELLSQVVSSFYFKKIDINYKSLIDKLEKIKNLNLNQDKDIVNACLFLQYLYGKKNNQIINGDFRISYKIIASDNEGLSFVEIFAPSVFGFNQKINISNDKKFIKELVFNAKKPFKLPDNHSFKYKVVDNGNLFIVQEFMPYITFDNH